MHIKIACYDFDVMRVSPKEAAAAGTYGSFSAVESLIRIENELNPDRELQTAIHETLHGIFKYYYGQGQDTEEQIVGALSIGIAQVIRDNPEFVRYLADLVVEINETP